MAKLAINGGPAVRAEPLPTYPMPGDDAEIEAAAGVLRSDNLTAQVGNEVAEFDQAYAAYHGARHCAACSNGTTALHMALAAARIGAGDEVIVTPLTFLASASSILMNNAIPVFADVEPNRWNLDPNAVAEKITPRTKGIIVVHLNGDPADMDALTALADKHNLVLIEDCAQAHGAAFGIQANTNATDNMVRVLKGRAAIIHDMDRQHLLRTGSPDAIAADIRGAIDTLGSPDGGLTICARFEQDAPLDSLRAVLDTMREYGGRWTACPTADGR